MKVQSLTKQNQLPWKALDSLRVTGLPESKAKCRSPAAGIAVALSGEGK